MQKILYTILFCICFISNLSAGNQNRYSETVNNISQLIDKHQYVDAYHKLIENYDIFTDNKYTYKYYSMMLEVLTIASQQSNDYYYKDKFCKFLEKFCVYALSHINSITKEDLQYVSDKLRILSEYYLQTKNSNFDNLKENMLNASLLYSDTYYPTFLNYYYYLFIKKEYGMASLYLKAHIYELEYEKGDKKKISELSHLYLVAISENYSEFFKDLYQSSKVISFLNKTRILYQKDNALEKSTEGISLYGDYALYYSITDNIAKAKAYLKKENNLIIKHFGKNSKEYAWHLYHDAFINHNDKDYAKATLKKSLDIYKNSILSGFDVCKESIVRRRYNRCFSLFENRDEDTYAAKSLEYQIDKIREINESYISADSKIYQLTNIYNDIININPLPINTIIRCVNNICELSFSNYNCDNENIVLPSDLIFFNDEIKKDGQINDEYLNKLFDGSSLEQIRLIINGAISSILNKKMMTLPIGSDLLKLNGDSYMVERNFIKANMYYQKALQYIYITPLYNLKKLELASHISKCYAITNKSDSCKIYLRYAESLLSQIKPSEHHSKEYISALDCIGEVYYLQNDCNKTMKISDEAIRISNNDFSLIRLYYSSIYRKSKILYNKKKYNQCAESLIPLCLADHKINDYELYNNILIKSLCKIHDERAFYYFRKYIDYSINELIPLHYSNKSQFAKEKLWNKKVSQIIQLCNEVALAFPQDYIIKYAYSTIMHFRSMDLRFDRMVSSAVRKGDKSIQEQYEELASAKDSLNFGNPIYRLLYKNRFAFAQTSLQNHLIRQGKIDISKKNSFNRLKEINSNTAVVEFVTVYKGNQSYYYAYITKRGMKAPMLIKICKGKELSNIITSTPSNINELYNPKNIRLYNLIWSKIEPSLNNNINNIKIIPTGILNRINFSAMPTKIGRLSDKYTLSRYSSSMSINENRAHKSRTDIDIALWGGINYDLSKEKFINLSNSNTSSDNNERGLFNQDRGKLNYLAYTQQEINLINKYFNKTKLRVKQFTGDEASESKFKKFSKHSPYIIHLATHGFYLKNKKEKNAHSFYNKNEDLHYKEQSLLYSGLLLAGAQYAWSGKKLPSNVEDGILTADEISRLDLSNTSLVVLSACETALGDIDNTEGVIGLQRAFKNAGVDNIIMSLWPVGDKQTALLMSYFYKYLLDNDNINVSLQKAMNKVKEKYPNPIDWAGFVLME